MTSNKSKLVVWWWLWWCIELGLSDTGLPTTFEISRTQFII